MPRSVVEDQPDLTIPEDTILKATLQEVKEKLLEWKDRQTGEDRTKVLWQWWFEVTDDTVGDGIYKGRRVPGETDSKLTNHAGNRARNWSEALLGRELPVGAGIDTDEDLVGLSCSLTIRHRKGTSKNGGERIFEEVDEIMSSDGYADVPF